MIMHRGNVPEAVHRADVLPERLRHTRVRLHMSGRRQRQELQVLEDQLPQDGEEQGREELPVS
jgi:hypothetical protein